MPRVDKTMLVAVLAGAAIAAVSASCANSCSGHGSCGSHDRCTCYAMWEGTDCSKKVCPSGPSFGSGGSAYEVCSGRGACDSGTGTCTCSEGYTGYNCGRTACPNDCSGHGKCSSTGVDNGMTRACVCDGYYTGVDCSFRQCPRGDDPLTTEIECQGVSSGAQSHEVQEITLTADKQLSGEMTLTYTDAYGQSWTTMPIEVGGDMEYDLRIAGTVATNGCSLKYKSATLTSEKFRESNDVSTDTDFDFGATEFGVPGVAAAIMNNVDCDTLTAQQMQSLLELNSVVKNVKVTKSGDASSGTARFHVSIGDLNFQNENDGMEIGVFSMTERSDAKFHSVGDRSQAIKDALQALPYNVIPSVEVSRVKVDGGSDYADSTVVYGNMVQQKYRITFSDAANAGDQAMLQCNAKGCDADGCAPRYKGVTHKRYISTKYGADPMSTEGSGVTDYRTAIVATGQGSWWLRSHSLDVRTQSPFTSGTYHVHWDLGNGKVSSASFPYNADQATIQSALRTIEGWGGVTVSCHGAAGFAGRKYDGVSNDKFGLECKVTYAVGFEDGGKLPTITYDNIHQGMDAAIDSSGAPTHYTSLIGGSVEIKCKNEICVLNDLGSVTASSGDYTSRALFLGALGQRSGASGTCSSGIDCHTAKQDNFIGYVYIRQNDASKKFPVEGTYEIVRVGSGLRTDDVADLVIYAPGVPDIANAAEAFGTTARFYKATPLMPMWPSYSNTIGLHDTSFRAVFAPTDNFRLGMKQDLTDATTIKNTIGHFPTTGAFNLVYGRDGAKDYTGSPTANIQVASTCDTILGMMDSWTGSGPYPSLASTDGSGTSICDCKRTAMEVSPFEVELTITCPGWLGYLLQSDTADDTASSNYLESFKKYDHAAFVIPDNTVPANLHTTKIYNVFFGHRRLSPERSLEQLVAVGDTITITASGSNDNKQFKVKSFAYDNMWGDGNKGSAIWSGKSGYLGADSSAATGLRAAIALSSNVDYASYGDFVPFLKVDPPPSDDYLVTELFAEGTNGTSFVRTLEDISTFREEVATLRLYDTPSTSGAAKEGQTTLANNVKFDASQLSGSFQLIYDGVESPVIPVTASANQMMQYLSEMSSLAHVPVVKKFEDSTEVNDDKEAVAALSASVKWEFTFDARYGDAKKLTFKFVDANTDERKTSNVLGSGGIALTNGIITEDIVSTASNKELKAVNNKIVMTYTSGSAFYDALDEDFDSTDDDTATDVDDHQLDNFFHDELAMDVVPGTKLKVSSAEVHHLYLYQMDVESASTAIVVLEKGCTTVAAEHPRVVIEYDGMFSSPKSLCSGSARTFADLAAMATSIKDDIAALNGISVSIDAEDDGVFTSSVSNAKTPAEMKQLFDGHFAWGAGHNGKARARVSFSLPIGVKGDTFKIHFQRGKASASTHRFGDGASSLSLFKVFTYRERNNNGREFTVTKAYENKVSDLISVSRIASYVKAAGVPVVGGGSLAGVINTPASDGSNAWASAGCGGDITTMNPGTYHNVETRASAVSGATETILGAGAVLMVVVDGNGQIAEVQVTSGGTGAYVIGQTVRFADKRLNSVMEFDDSAKECSFVVGDMTSSKTMSSPLKSIASGISTANSCMSVAAGTGACDIGGGGDANADAKFYNVPTDNAAAPSSEETIRGMRLAVECDSSSDLTTATVTFGGLSTLNAETRLAGTDNVMPADADSSIRVGSGAGLLAVNKECVNEFYYQFGFYSTNTPRWNRDNAQNNYDLGKTPKDQQVALYGMKNHMQYQYRYASAKNADHSFYGLGRDTFTDLNAGMDATMAGYSITDSNNDGMPQMTASVIAGENGQDADTGSNDNLFEFMENAEKYAYIGKGYDKLTVTPMPDEMTSQKVIIEYTGPSAGCTVTEVDRGTHESSECSGRGNCDYATGTCICDAGYTLEACSEQTVLV